MIDTSRRPLEYLIQQLNIISNEGLDSEEATINKNLLSAHPMKDALFAELCEIKARIVISAYNSDKCYENIAKIERLDNMLHAEGILSLDQKPLDMSDKPHVNHADYQLKLGEIRNTYQQKIADYENTENNFSQQIKLLLQHHQINRPITDQEVGRFVDIIRQKFVEAQIKIKQCTCENIIEFKSKFFDARRKRRNFTKKTTDILNAYFRSHIDNPYPDDAMKEHLARQCNITVSQVTNWFGNKRIRYKKGISRGQREANEQLADQGNQYGMLNAAAILNPYLANPNMYAGVQFPTIDQNY